MPEPKGDLNFEADVLPHVNAELRRSLAKLAHQGHWSNSMRPCGQVQYRGERNQGATWPAAASNLLAACTYKQCQFGPEVVDGGASNRPLSPML